MRDRIIGEVGALLAAAGIILILLQLAAWAHGRSIW